MEQDILNLVQTYRELIAKTGDYAPGSATVFDYRDIEEDTYFVSATVSIKYRAGDDTWHDCSQTAFYREFDKETDKWKKSPTVMLEACALGMLLKRCFPIVLAGLTSVEEITMPGFGLAVAEAICEDQQNLEVAEALYQNDQFTKDLKLKFGEEKVADTLTGMIAACE